MKLVGRYLYIICETTAMLYYITDQYYLFQIPLRLLVRDEIFCVHQIFLWHLKIHPASSVHDEASSLYRSRTELSKNNLLQVKVQNFVWKLIKMAWHKICYGTILLCRRRINKIISRVSEPYQYSRWLLHWFDWIYFKLFNVTKLNGIFVIS